MAIQSRRGNISNFDKSKMLPGEWGIALDSQEAFICFGAGITKKMATDEDYADMINESVTATENAKQATVNANTAVADFRALEVSKMAINDGVRSTVSGWSSSKIGTELDTTNAKVNTLNTSLGNQIGTVTGSSINITNSYNGGLLLKELQGKSIQNGVPSPTNKVDIVSVGDSGSVVVNVCGKNLIHNTATTKTVSGIAYTVSSDGSFVANGTSTGYSSLDLFGTSVSYTKTKLILRKGVSYYNSSGREIKFIETNGTFRLVSNNATITPTYDMFIGYVYFEFATASGTTINSVVIKPQLELGTTSTTYEPYKGQTVTIPLTQPLRSVNSVYDRGCVKSGGLWGNERKLTKLIVDGSTYNLALNNSTASTIYNQFTITLPFNAKNNLLCNKLPKGGQVGHNTTNENIWLSLPNTLVIVLEKSKATTVAEFKTWLSNNPFEVILELATSTFEPFAQSIQDALNKLQSYQGVTNVFTTDALQPTLIVEYGKTDTAALTLYANNIYDNKIDKSKVTNSLAVTEDGFVADARGLKVLKDGLDTVNNNLQSLVFKNDGGFLQNADTAPQGISILIGGGTNNPYNFHCTLLTIGTGDYQQQIGLPWGKGESAIVKFRAKDAGIWGDWTSH